MIYSAIGLRHIFPWQIKSILTQTPPAVFLHHITQSRNRHAISKPRCSHHSCERHARLVFFVQNSTPPNGILLAFHPAGYLNYEELFFILRKLWSCNSPAGIEEAVARRCCPCLPRCLLYLYHSRFSISRNVFFTKCSFAGMKCRKTLPESEKLSAVLLCRFLINRHEKGFPDRKPFHFAILRPVRM